MRRSTAAESAPARAFCGRGLAAAWLHVLLLVCCVLALLPSRDVSGAPLSTTAATAAAATADDFGFGLEPEPAFHRRLRAKKKVTAASVAKRADLIATTIKNAAGIYREPSKVARFATDRTVLVNVLSFRKDSKHETYIQLLSNWFCFTSHYGLRPLTYLVPDEGRSFSQQVQDLHSLGIFGEFVTYPNDLFFDLVAKRNATAKKPPRAKVDYVGALPSFEHYGTLVKLVPILEVLSYGYDVIFFDLDLGFVHDPIPPLMTSQADFLMSIESRTCYCPSDRDVALETSWHLLEPNSGIMRVRSNAKSLDVMYKWIQRMVDGYVAADQRALDFIALGARITFDCNDHLQPIADRLMQRYVTGMEKDMPWEALNLTSAPRYCFLNEYAFQNGKLGLQCARNQQGSSAEYLLAMDKQNLTVWNEKTQRYEKSLAPSVLHANFCTDKVGKLKEMGLWVHAEANNEFHSQVCVPYEYEKTKYGQTVWEDELNIARTEMNKLEALMYNGSVFKLYRTKYLMMLINGEFRPIPDDQTFEQMGLNRSAVHFVGRYNALKRVPVGSPLPLLRASFGRAQEVRDNEAVKVALRAAAGIYHDASRASRYQTQKSVLMTVFAYNEDRQKSGSTSLTLLLHNWLCFTAHHGLKPLVYLVPKASMTFGEQVKELQALGLAATFAQYPEDLFWAVVNSKITDLNEGQDFVDYHDKVPSREHFGSLVNMVPMLEVLQSGYDAVYLDIDVALVHDPVPYLVAGGSNVDLSVSLSCKTCFLPSVPQIALLTDWKSQEAHTGVMRVASTQQGIELYRRWVRTVVDDNVEQDTRSLDIVAYGAKISFDCNPPLAALAEPLVAQFNESLPSRQQFSAESFARHEHPRVCFYNEYIFQTSRVILRCAKNRGGSVAEYLTAMQQQNITVQGEVRSMAPALVQMNFQSKKKEELQKLGLWLSIDQAHDFSKHSLTCRRYRYEDTSYGRTNWQQRLVAATEELDKVRALFRNGSVVQLFRSSDYHMVVDGQLRLIPDEATLRALGFDAASVGHPGRYNLVKAMPFGSPLLSITESGSSSTSSEAS